MAKNAGITRPESFLDVTPESYREIMDTNLRSVYFGCQAAIERMIESGGGSIVNLSSTSGLVGSRTSATYSASKGGIRLLTYSLAAQFGRDGIRVNVVHPGSVPTAITMDDLGTVSEADNDTSAIPLGRVGAPEEMADGVVFLASDPASYVTAESLVIDGGRTNAA
jgi:NAD(P)-dependent dehydrogenase (short-subunit alcohol dehydrogenase family)